MFKKPRYLDDLPRHEFDLCEKEVGYLLMDLQNVATEMIEVASNEWLAIIVDGILIDYGFYQFLISEGPGTPVYVKCVWRGSGTGGALREMRHTYFNPDDLDKDYVGYCFYFPLKGSIAAMQHLTKYFDG